MIGPAACVGPGSSRPASRAGRGSSSPIAHTSFSASPGSGILTAARRSAGVETTTKSPSTEGNACASATCWKSSRCPPIVATKGDPCDRETSGETSAGSGPIGGAMPAHDVSRPRVDRDRDPRPRGGHGAVAAAPPQRRPGSEGDGFARGDVPKLEREGVGGLGRLLEEADRQDGVGAVQRGLVRLRALHDRPGRRGPHVIVVGLVRHLELEALGGLRAGRDRRGERLARDRHRRVRHLDVPRATCPARSSSSPIATIHRWRSAGGPTAITEGERVNEPGSSNTGWLRITATAFGGTELAAISGSSGTAIWTFQSAPTC